MNETKYDEEIKKFIQEYSDKMGMDKLISAFNRIRVELKGKDVIIYNGDPNIKPKVLRVDIKRWNFPKYIDSSSEKFEHLPWYILDYIRRVIKGRWVEAEEYLRLKPNIACNYARFHIKGRWPEAEEIIKKDPYCACEYARYVIKGRWPEAEECIIKGPIYEYARYVIKGRWLEAEKNLSKDEINVMWICYKKFFKI